MRRCILFGSALSLTLLGGAGHATAAQQNSVKPTSRISQAIDGYQTIRLQGNVHPLTISRASQTVDENTPMERMILLLKGDSLQEAQLADLVAQQHNPKSPLYHRYLTPQDFAVQFGTAKQDLSKITDWLTEYGFRVDEVLPSNRAIVFSGTTGQIASAFKTEIREYDVAGQKHLANASDPQIPSALADVVTGIVKLHDFRHGNALAKATPVTPTQFSDPEFNAGSGHYLAPADYSTIYDINSLYSAGTNGTGQAIAVIARSNISLSDVESFRTMFGLPANNPQILIVNSNPGIVNGDSTETTLDTEWSGAVARNATVKVVVAASTNSADGIDLAALYAVNNNVAPIISLSYGSCESAMGTAELAFYNSLWQQAAAQGISVFVSSGDSGAAGCSGGSSTVGSGRAVNGLCSSPYATCVGGTEFVEGNNPGQYWLPGNNSVYGSAITYIPEVVWNESASAGGSGLWSGGGGASQTYGKPVWQVGPGVPQDGHRDVPDVALTAAGHDGYIIRQSGGLLAISGTSAAAPAFAGLMALVNQKTNMRQGLANSVLYPLAAKQSTGGAAVFHDVKSGNNSVPGVTGYSAATAYDLASGLGSVDAAVLVNHWTDGVTAPPSLSLTASSSSVTLKAGQTTSVTVTSNASANLQSAVALTVTGAPTGLSAGPASTSIASPGSGSVVLTLSASSGAQPGTYTLTVNAKGGSQSASLPITVTITAPASTFSLTVSQSTVIMNAGTTAQLSLVTAHSGTFNSAIGFGLAGLPTGVTATLARSTLASPGDGVTGVAISATSAAKPGTYALSFIATGGGISQTVPVTLTVTANPAQLAH